MIKLILFHLQTLVLLSLVSFFAIATAIPAPLPIPATLLKELKPKELENAEDLKEGDEEKDLKGSESVYHGYYGGYPIGAYPSYYYSNVYSAAPYYSYAYRPYSYWW